MKIVSLGGSERQAVLEGTPAELRALAPLLLQDVIVVAAAAEHAVAVERAAAVAWLRAHHTAWRANAIERGEHVEAGKTPAAATGRATICAACGAGMLDGQHIADYPPCEGKP